MRMNRKTARPHKLHIIGNLCEEGGGSQPCGRNKFPRLFFSVQRLTTGKPFLHQHGKVFRSKALRHDDFRMFSRHGRCNTEAYG